MHHARHWGLVVLLDGLDVWEQLGQLLVIPRGALGMLRFGLAFGHAAAAGAFPLVGEIAFS